jgi:predicted DNA-binding antitoxin AbrB/MazE fold protein
MSKYVDAVYENGVLKLAEPLELAERAAVKVHVEQTSGPFAGLADLMDWEAMEWARQMSGENPIPAPVEELQATWTLIGKSLAEQAEQERGFLESHK